MRTARKPGHENSFPLCGKTTETCFHSMEPCLGAAEAGYFFRFALGDAFGRFLAGGFADGPGARSGARNRAVQDVS